ncbi:MAG: gfo/Idh/MocA family oxidoreductase, partial [Novosphingobium sp.]
TAKFDFRQTGPQSWDIAVEADKGSLRLSHGGSTLTINGTAQPLDAEQEYPALYQKFAELVAEARSEVDLAPLRLVADSFLIGKTCLTDDFTD